MEQRILLCSDLDRTILPNGPQAESPQARPRLRRLLQRPEITLVYVSGRHKMLIQRAIQQYALPFPDYAIGDVGATIYEISSGKWRVWNNWSKEIGKDWQGANRADLERIFSDIQHLQLQEPEKQNQFKLSYYVPLEVNRETLISCLEKRLDAHGVQAALIWSMDETAQLGLLDILPKRANKLHALSFLLKRKRFPENRVVFAGDSGNDLEVLTSGLQAILVRNAQQAVRDEALRLLPAKYKDRLYLARGSFMGLNGYYSAGLLEGLAHFFPETRVWIESSENAVTQEEAVIQPCAVYRSHKKNGSYLYLETRDDFSRVPEKLLEMLGSLEFVMRLALHPETSLAQADTREVIRMLKDNGYFLQLSGQDITSFKDKGRKRVMH